MGGKLRKTNPELLNQRRALERYRRFLPTLVLKQQLIQAEILRVRLERAELRAGIDLRLEEVGRWLGELGDSLPGPLTRLVSVAGVRTRERNVAGIPLQVLDEVDFRIRPYSPLAAPAWVEAGIEFVKGLLEKREALRLSIGQEMALGIELRKVTQRVNLFEKVMIPQARENIRTIRISLAEEQTAGVGRAKIAKALRGAAPAGATP